jgi:hypothetical protein
MSRNVPFPHVAGEEFFDPSGLYSVPYRHDTVSPVSAMNTRPPADAGNVTDASCPGVLIVTVCATPACDGVTEAEKSAGTW